MSKRILVVEDQPDNRQIIRDMLAPTDYEITEVESGEEALALSRKAAARSHSDGYPTTDYGRLHRHGAESRLTPHCDRSSVRELHLFGDAISLHAKRSPLRYSSFSRCGIGPRSIAAFMRAHASSKPSI